MIHRIILSVLPFDSIFLPALYFSLQQLVLVFPDPRISLYREKEKRKRAGEEKKYEEHF